MPSLHSTPLLKIWIFPAPFEAKMERKQTVFIPAIIISYFCFGTGVQMAKFTCGAVSWSVRLRDVRTHVGSTSAPHQYKLPRLTTPYTVQTAGLYWAEFMCRKATVWAKLKDPGCGPASPACLTTPELPWFCGWPRHPRPGLCTARNSRHSLSFRPLPIIICRLFGAVVCVIHWCSWRRCFSLRACSALMFHGAYHWRSAS